MRSKQQNGRILIVDDNEGVHHDFRRILPTEPQDRTLDALAGELFDTPASKPRDEWQVWYEIASAYSGAEAVEHATLAKQAGTPYAVAFVDIRMPAGWDGVETALRLWDVLPSLQIVLCSAYSDYSWEEITLRLGLNDRFLILKKPFEPVEVSQLACALVEKWRVHAELAETTHRLSAQYAAGSALLAAIPDPILRISADGTCVDARPSAVLPGLLREDAVFPGDLHELVPQGVAEPLLRVVRQAIERGTVQVLELGDLTIGDKVCHVEVRAVRSGPAEAVVLVRDATEQKRMAADAAARMRQEQLIEAQSVALSTLSAPLIPITDEVVVMPLIGVIDAQRATRVREALIEGVAARRAKVAIVDVTGVPSMDGATAEEILRWASAVRLLGTELILTGIRPEVSRAMILHGADLKEIATHRNLQSGVAFALQRTTMRGEGRVRRR
jgi:anti-anti-sigma factor